MGEDFLVTISDIRATGHCVKGIKKGFEIYNLDFRKFLHEGISAQTLIDTGDAIALDVVNRIKEARDGRR